MNTPRRTWSVSGWAVCCGFILGVMLAYGLAPGTAGGQTPGINPGLGSSGNLQNYPQMPSYNGAQSPFVPNYFNRASQPVSPYLNLLRGGNPAVNYFYGVRPGTLPNYNSAVPSNLNGAPGMGTRNYLLPFGPNTTSVATTTTDPNAVLPSLLPSGHPVQFGPGMSRFAPGLLGTPPRAAIFGNPDRAAFDRRTRR